MLAAIAGAAWEVYGVIVECGHPINAHKELVMCKDLDDTSYSGKMFVWQQLKDITCNANTGLQPRSMENALDAIADAGKKYKSQCVGDRILLSKLKAKQIINKYSRQILLISPKGASLVLQRCGLGVLANNLATLGTAVTRMPVLEEASNLFYPTDVPFPDGLEKHPPENDRRKQ